MSGPNFVFPPPPPPPPQATSPSYPSYAQPAYSPHSGYGARGNRGDRGSRPRGRGENYRGSRGGGYRGPSQGSAGGYGGYPPRDVGHYNGQQNDRYSHQANGGGRSSYPLPEYPPVQQPQYAPPLHNGYSYHSPPPYSPAVANSHPPQPPYVTNRSNVNPRYDDPPHHTPYGYDPRPQNDSYRSHESHRPGPSQHRPPNKHNQPVLMGPPIRMGFDSQPSGDFRQAPPPIQPPFQHPVSNGASPYHNDHHYDRHYDRHYDGRAPYRQDSPGGYHANHHSSPNPFPGNRGRGQKRGHSDAFGKPRPSNSRTPAPPAVPSFGNPLPVKPPAPQENGRKPRKKKRRHNQLGLTPKAEEHESSSEEEDADEEARLAAAAGAVGSVQTHHQFTYKGQTANLQSPSDIAAWIAERKKRFPTKARAEEVAEQKRKLQEAQKAANEARKEKQEQRKAEIKDKKKLDDLNEAAQKAKLKAEKLRKQLKKEEKRIARAEAEAAKAKNGTTAAANSKTMSNQETESKKRKREGSVASTASEIANGRNEVKVESMDISKVVGDSAVQNDVVKSATPDHTPDQTTAPAEPPISATEALTNRLQPAEGPSPIISDLALPAETHAPVPEADNQSTLPESSHISADTDDDDSMSMSNSSSDILSDDDDTSSNGSSSDDDEEEEEAPDEAPSTRDGPIRVPPPKREKPKTVICRDFLQKGHCKRGDACKFRHKLPKRGSKSATKMKERGSKEEKSNEGGKRVGLYQRMMEQETEKEDRHIVQAIVYLGQQGLLDATGANGAMAKVPSEE